VDRTCKEHEKRIEELEYKVRILKVILGAVVATATFAFVVWFWGAKIAHLTDWYPYLSGVIATVVALCIAWFTGYVCIHEEED